MNWGYSSAGRAPALHAGGQRFDPAYLHHLSSLNELNQDGYFRMPYSVYLPMITENYLFYCSLKKRKQAEN